MEMLPETFKAIENNIKILSRISTYLLEEKKKQKKKTASRGSLWKSWKERVIKRPATAHALRPDQMISDQFATEKKVSEIQDMLQELIGTSMFNKLENNAIKYISSTTVNLSKALSTLNDEVKAVNLHTSDIYANETVEREQEISLKIIQDLSERNEMLQQKLQEAEEKYENLIRSKVLEHQALPTSTLKVLPEPSPQSAISQDDTEDNLDSILAKEFENMVDEAPQKGTKALGIKWDSSHLYAAQGETTEDLTGEQKKSSGEITEDKISVKKGGAFQKDGADEFQSQKKKHTKGLSVQETSETNVNDDKGKQKVTGTKPDHHLELQALDKKRKETKSSPEAKSKSLTESKNQHFPSDFLSDKSQGGKSGTSGILEQLRKAKSEYSQSKSQISSENKEELTTESMNKDGRNEMSSPPEPSSLSQLDYSSEKIKGKKHHISPESTTRKEEKSEEKDTSVFTKKFKSLTLAKSGIPDGESEQSNLEEVQKAIVSFLKEKTDNIGKPWDKKTESKKELLRRSEVEKLGIVKTKMEEYFQKVAETVTKILRKYKDTKNEGRIREKPLKQKKAVSFMPEQHSQETTSAKSEISTLISQERLDPLTDNLIQMILTELESERNVPEASTVGTDYKEKEKQELEERWFEMINKNLEKEGAWLPVKEGKQGQQKQKQWQEEEVWKGQQKHKIQKQIESDEKQKQREEEKEGYQKSKQQQLEAWKQKMKQQGVPLEKEKGQQMMQVQKEVRHLEQESSWEREEEKQKARRKVGDYESQNQKTAKKMKPSEQLEQVLSQTSIPLFHRWESTQKDIPQIHQRKDFTGNLKQLGDLAEGKHPTPITTPISTQSSSRGSSSVSGASLAKSITLTSRLAQAMEIDLTSEEVEALEITDTFNQVQALRETTPKMSQGLGMALSTEQAQALGIPVTLQQVQAQGIMLTHQQVKALGVTLTHEQAQAPGITLTPQQAQALGILVTPQQAQAQGITLTPQQAKALGITLTPEQAQAPGITLTPQQAQALGITLTPEQAQAPGITLTPQQAQALGITLTPDQAQAPWVSLTSQQAEALRIHITPEQVQAQDLTLTPQQFQALRIPVTIPQARDLGAPFTLGQAQALGVSFSREQFAELGVPLTSDKVYTLEYPHIPEQIQHLDAPFTPGEAWSVGITVRSVQDPKSTTPLMKEQPLPPWAGPPSEHTLKAGISSITDKSVTKHAPHTPKVSSVSSAAIAEKSLVFEVPSTPMRLSRFPLKQAPSEKFLGMRIPSDPEKLLAPQTSPSSRQTLVSKDLSTSVPFPTPVPSPIFELSPTSQQPLEPEALLSSGRFFISRDSMTPQSPLILKPLPDRRQPLISGVPVTSAQIPKIWAPLSPGTCLFPGTSSIPQEVLKSGPLTLSEQFQATQTFATRKQSPQLQAPSALGQHLPSRTLPGQASSAWVSPTPGHPRTLLTPSIPEKPQKDLSSAVSKKRKERLSIISSLKLKSVLVHPSAPSFKVIQAPDASEEIQIPEDPFTVERFRMFKSHLTDYKTPVSQAPYVHERTLPTLIKPVTPLPSLITTQLLKTRQSSPSEWDRKSPLPPINMPWVLTSVSGTKQPKMMVPTSYPQELKEQNYFVDVEAQRKNLILLNQATKASILPSQLHTEARNLIIETLHTDKVRLGYLFRKYNAYRLIQRARNNIIKRLQAIQNTGSSYETQNLYIMLKRIDDYQKKVMQIWTEKQNSLEQKRNRCLRKMMYLFNQLQEAYKLNLDQPIPLVIEKKQIPASTKSVQQPYLKLLKEDKRKYNILNKFRKDDQLQAIWNADLSTSSYPITEKTSMHSLWAQLGGYPDIPMLLQLDVQSAFIRSLTYIQSRFKKIPSSSG
nr:protein FAM186A isoform X4 [Odocoileus virginianus texanus]